MVIILAISAYFSINYGISNEDLIQLVGIGGLTVSGGALGIKDIALKIKEYINYKKAPYYLKILAERLKASVNVASNVDELLIIDDYIACLYNGLDAFLYENDIKDALTQCGIT